MRQNVNPQQTLDFLNLIYCLPNRPIEFLMIKIFGPFLGALIESIEFQTAF